MYFFLNVIDIPLFKYKTTIAVSHIQKLRAGHIQGSYKKQDLKIKDFSRTFQHLIILIQDHFIFIESALNVAMQKWVLRKQDTL